MLHDLRVSVRTLGRSPGFALTAVGALALGIGANAAIFSLVNQVLLNPAGVSQPGRVVAVRAKYDKLNLRSISVSVPDFADVRESRDTFEHAAIVQQGDFNYTGGDAPERLQGASVSLEWFDVFGAKPQLGRVFTADEDQPNANQVAVLSQAAWRRLFGGDPGVLGKTIALNERPYRIIGVMGPEFRWPRATDLWVPLGLARDAYSENNRFNESMTAFARMRPGIPFERANALIQMLCERLKRTGTRGATYAANSDWGMFAVPMTDFIAGDTRKPLLILMGAVGFVLLIACSNIAGLMLARTTGRAREIAVRTALGAGRWRLMRQTMSESILLAAAGAIAGLAVAYAGVRVLLLLAPERATAGLAAGLDVKVLLFTALSTALSAALFGLVPAWQIGNLDANEVLKGTGRSGMSGRGRQRLRAGLVVCETALALMLLVGAGLFLRSLARVEDVRPGFDPNGVMTASLTLPRTRYPDNERRIAFYHALADRLSGIPGVTAAALGLPLPFSGNESSASFRIQEKPTGAGDPGPHGDVRVITPAYFQALGIPLKSGRYFTDQDREGTERVAIIDENLARQYWQGTNPIGFHISGGARGGPATIIGVVGHVRHSDLAADTGKGVYYYSMWQTAAPFTQMAVKTPRDPATLAAPIREAVRAVDAAQPVSQFKTMQDLVANSLAPRRFVVQLLGFFAIVSLLMAALGLYGVISYSVTQRTQEIGIRVALGASRRAVLALVVGEGVQLALLGAAIGLAASVASGRWLRSQLFEVTAFDPLTFLAMALVLVGAAFLASYIPARRAMAVHPTEALRYE
jgi:predicted permease